MALMGMLNVSADRPCPGQHLQVSGGDENIMKKWYVIIDMGRNSSQKVFKNWPDFTGQAR
jgi:hypothetical protein